MQWASGRKKKLVEAAAHWARGTQPQDGLEAERRALAELGFPDDEIDRALVNLAEPDAGGEDEDVFWLWAENAEAFDIFCALDTQWHIVSGLGGVAYSGLNYPSATDEMRERGIPRRRRLELRQDLRAMERAAMKVLNRKSDG